MLLQLSLSGLDDARLEEDMDPVLSTVGLQEILFMSSFSDESSFLKCSSNSAMEFNLVSLLSFPDLSS